MARPTPSSSAHHAERLDAAHDGHGHDHPHDAGHSHGHDHGHSHGLVHESIKRSREGIRAVLTSLGVLGRAAVAQTVVFVLSGSVALLADLIHNYGDALTAIPLGIAFLMRSERAEAHRGPVRRRGHLHQRLRGRRGGRPASRPPPYPRRISGSCRGRGHRLLWATSSAAKVRRNAGHRLDSPALIADGNHAAADAYVSLAVIAAAIVVAIGVPIADPLIGLAITVVILRITWQSWATVRGHEHHH